MQGSFEDLTWRRFGRLLVEERIGTDPWGSALWQCWCLCGNTCTVSAGKLRSRHTTSCGCSSSRATVAERSRTHGEAPRGRDTAEHRTWAAMMTRCYNENVAAYKDYGGRGIAVCAHWHKFESFLKDMGRRPGPGYSIERVKNELGYSKNNCVWATTKEQARNKRSTRFVQYAGRRMSIGELVEVTGAPYTRTWTRIVKYGWSAEEAVAPEDGRRREDVQHAC